MKNDLKYQGYFFLPGNESNAIFGTLTYTPSDGILLELAGSLTDELHIRIFTPDIILGTSLNGKKITLHKCLATNSTMSSPGYHSSKFSAIHLFIGAHFNNINCLKFSEVYLQFNNLDEWLDVSGFKIDDSKLFSEKELKINYKLPEKIYYKLNENTDFGFSFRHSDIQISAFQKSFSLEQSTNLFFLFNKNPADLNNILDLVNGFQNFLALATFDVTYPCSIILINRESYIENENREYPEEIQLFYKRSIMFDEPHKRDKFQMLFPYEKIGDEFQQMFIQWLNIRKDLEPSINLLFDYFYRSKTFSTNHFLNIIHAIETYHRRRFKNYLISPEIHKIKLNLILNSVPEDYRSWLKEKLIFSHEPSLKERLEEIIGTVKSDVLLKVIGNKDVVIKDAKNSRNYYVHFSEDIKKKALSGGKLYRLTEKLKFLLIYCLLKDIGISEDTIAELFGINDYFLFGHLNY